MERHFDVLRQAVASTPAAFREEPAVKAALRVLTRYYENGRWQRDYEMDEKGLLPRDLKRGVLAQDALYDLFGQVDAVIGETYL